MALCVEVVTSDLSVKFSILFKDFFQTHGRHLYLVFPEFVFNWGRAWLMKKIS